MASFCSRLKSSKDAPERTTKEEDLLKGRSIGAVTPTDASWPGSDSGRYYGGSSGAAILLSSYRDLHHISNGGGNSNATTRSNHIFSYNSPFSDSVSGGGAGYMIGSETGRGSWSGGAAADPAGALTWPPRSYHCTFCRREFRSAQALGGHMNVHRRDRARLRHSSPTEMSPPPPPPAPPPLFSAKSTSLSSPTTTTTTTLTSNSATSNASAGIQLQHILRRHQGGEASPPRTLHLLSPAMNGKAASSATGVTKYWASSDSDTRDGRRAAATGLICSETAAALSLRGGEVRQLTRSVKKPCTGILQPAAKNYMNNNENQEEEEEMEAYSGKKMGRRMAAGAAEISLMTAEAAVDLELRLGGAASYARPLLR